MAKESGFVKDALILFAITLISGVALGGVYEITKEPIRQATIAQNNATYKEVYQVAESFEDIEIDLDALNAEIAGLAYGNVGIESVLEAKDASGAGIGYVINSYSNDSYGGKVGISVGLDADGNIVAVGIRETSDTPGLGLKAKDDAFKGQYAGKSGELGVTKAEAGDSEIKAISGATITSNAVTNAVNAASYVKQSLN